MDERVLLVEDDSSIRTVVTMGLRDAGMRVTAAGTGREGLDHAQAAAFDAVLLDVMLPEMNGMEVLRALRRDSRVPVVMLTARSDTVDVVVALELGADDYVTKPFQMAELVARLRAVMRRATVPRDGDVITVGHLEIDPDAFQARRDGEELALTATEFRLLHELASHPGQALTREQLLERVWGYDYLGDSRLVDVAVQRLRAKIEPDPSKPELIQTVRGVGYRCAGTRR